MILIGIGANLSTPGLGTPRNACEVALRELEKQGIAIERRSRWYRSEPVPVSDQPWYINGVALLQTPLPPDELLQRLHGIENSLGRVRKVRNEARVIDLDLLSYDGLVSQPGACPILPHPRLLERAFVVLPLVEVAPEWRHPVTGKSGKDLISGLPAGQVTELDG
ncbi:2-amino-4-hydroxy-6-hydroxymethyldihydropteridine diphosphokinase [Denitrobaculum tricleocarpae]|uniref:2-amino-4-hydroxy-6-hydroxymethyldihydropteridine pyrophosphokinase n=1 Tax=Denitrobaculum tricleocarpae TaxID=2591009 RepID=A0A545TTX6_9PROT|nr:2-amino-4-hydroxy-6-hydroxymethyldihydropteridine diphosphokinase [Denitrobaculum tricleocarpae]TQV80611.1 2-amino-4-hydroxy-6-hydroxymethyldihydropteridine diphosphokinase [Denitrobaculum tricleocarpae]